MDYSHCFGLSFGRLKVIGYAGPKDKLSCVCECGKAKLARLSHLRAGSVKSCGCLLIDTPRAVFGKTLASTSLEYKVWDGMKRRCADPRHYAYKSYGGRGIFVCPEWRGDHGFETFRRDMGPKLRGQSLDRIDNDGPYSPDNCRWTDAYRQSNNRRNNVNLTHSGRTQTIAEWSRELGIGQTTISARLELGWTADRALTQPIRSASGCRLSV